MSRNIDKANSTLAKYQEQQANENSGYKDYSRYKRPRRVASVTNYKEAIQWRLQLINEFKVLNTRAFDPSVNEDDLREINDKLNALVQEKKRWDWHINKKLKPNGKMGKDSKDGFVIGGKLVLGKRYFGRAIELPEIRDYIEEQKRKQLLNKPRELVDIKKVPNEKDRSNSRSTVYYGKSDASNETDKNRLEKFENEWTPVLQRSMNLHKEDPPKNSLLITPIPTQSDMEKWLVERRKAELLKKLDL